jgi:hypothetical protein
VGVRAKEAAKLPSRETLEPEVESGRHHDRGQSQPGTLCQENREAPGASYPVKGPSCFAFCFVLVTLGFELRALHLLGWIFWR